jgi:hypothetical protein
MREKSDCGHKNSSIDILRYYDKNSKRRDARWKTRKTPSLNVQTAAKRL